MIPLANKYYKAQGVSSSAAKSNRVMVARKNNEIIGIARLAPIGKYWFLTGVHVTENDRGQGVASQLIRALCALQPDIYSFPHQHLVGLYQSLNFTQLSLQELPTELTARFLAYSKQGRKIVAMIN